jgi:hypothetical protein
MLMRYFVFGVLPLISLAFTQLVRPSCSITVSCSALHDKKAEQEKQFQIQQKMVRFRLIAYPSVILLELSTLKLLSSFSQSLPCEKIRKRWRHILIKLSPEEKTLLAK